MPSIQFGNMQSEEIKSKLRSANFDYEYPDGLDLKPGNKQHDELVTRLLEYANESAKIISSRFSSWNEMDQLVTAYKYADDDEARLKASDPRKPVSIVFPYTYAILETLQSYMMTAFFRDPLFRYEGYSPDDVLGAILLEQVVNLHCNKFKVMLNLHTQHRDSFVYGIGPVAPIWKVHSDGKFEGNALINIDPYRYLPDPNVGVDSVQDGQYVGWISSSNYVDLLTEEQHSEDMFNVRYLKVLGTKTTAVQSDSNSGRDIRTGSTKSSSDRFKPIDEIPMYVKLIPSEWGLGSGEYPEKWFFRLAADSVIITARKAGFDHNKFPVAVSAPDFDGYSATPLSRLEILSGLQGVLDWLFNSHIANVRKAINDMIIYDPYLVNARDLEDPQPGKLVRMRRPAWGQGKIGDSVQQLVVNDITRANIADSNWIVNWMQKIGGTDDATMGSLREGGPERLTKAEFQGTSSGAVSRLERIARIIGLQSMQDIGEFFAAHTQQMMDDDVYVKIQGSWTDVLLKEYTDSISRGRMKVSAKQLNINYDVLVRDGSIPGGNYSEVWMRMFDILAQHPELGKHFDIVSVFKHIARNAGAKNINDFVRRGGGMQPSMMPDEQVQQQAQAGNIVPIGG